MRVAYIIMILTDKVAWKCPNFRGPFIGILAVHLFKYVSCITFVSIYVFE